MAPHAEDASVAAIEASNTTANGQKEHFPSGSESKDAGLPKNKQPLQLKGLLEHFEYFDVTPVIGREFKGVDLVNWLQSPNSDELIRDLAITSELMLGNQPLLLLLC